MKAVAFGEFLYRHKNIPLFTGAALTIYETVLQFSLITSHELQTRKKNCFDLNHTNQLCFFFEISILIILNEKKPFSAKVLIYYFEIK